MNMEKVLDASFRPDHTRLEIHDPVKAQKSTFTRCCNVALQVNSMTGRLESCKGDQSTRPPGREEPTVAIGHGVYFQSLPSNPSLDSDCDISELQNLFKLATVACEVESIKHRQFVKKRRTPRKVLWINESSSTQHGKFRKRSPAAGAPDVAKRQRNLTAGHTTQLSWREENHDTRAFTSRRNCRNIHNSSNTVTLKFVSQHVTVGKKIMACQPKSSNVKFNKVLKGNNRVSSVLSKRRACQKPGKDTRVESVAKRILEFVGDGSTAEKFIRGAFGNNPDTSKALRLLLTEHKVYRIGDGGRGKAFLYVATPAGLRELEELKSHDIITTDNSAKSHGPNHNEDGLHPYLKDSFSPLQHAHDGILAPRYAFKDLTNCLPGVTISQNVVHAVLGKNKE